MTDNYVMPVKLKMQNFISLRDNQFKNVEFKLNLDIIYEIFSFLFDIGFLEI